MFSNQVLKLPYYYRPGDTHAAFNLDWKKKKNRKKNKKTTQKIKRGSLFTPQKMCFALLHFRMPQVEWFKSLRLVGCYLTVVIDAFLTAATIGAQTPSQQLFGDKLKYYWNQGITWQNRVSEVNVKACLSAKREYRVLSLTLPAAATMAICSPADPAVGLMRAYSAPFPGLKVQIGFTLCLNFFTR